MGAREDIAKVMIAFLALDGVVLGLRVFVRTRVNKTISYDDYTMCVAFVCSVLQYPSKNSTHLDLSP